MNNIWTRLAARHGIDRGVIKNIGHMIGYSGPAENKDAAFNYIAKRFNVSRETIDKIADDLYLRRPHA